MFFAEKLNSLNVDISFLVIIFFDSTCLLDSVLDLDMLLCKSLLYHLSI